MEIKALRISNSIKIIYVPLVNVRSPSSIAVNGYTATTIFPVPAAATVAPPAFVATPGTTGTPTTAATAVFVEAGEVGEET